MYGAQSQPAPVMHFHQSQRSLRGIQQGKSRQAHQPRGDFHWAFHRIIDMEVPIT